LEKEEDRDQSQDPRTGIKEEVSSHDSGDGSACSNGGDLGAPVGIEMSKSSSNTGDNIEEEVTEVTEPVFNVIPEDVEEPHIAKDVQETAVKKHGGDKREDLFEHCKLDGEAWIGISDRDNAIEEKGLFQ